MKEVEFSMEGGYAGSAVYLSAESWWYFSIRNMARFRLRGMEASMGVEEAETSMTLDPDYMDNESREDDDGDEYDVPVGRVLETFEL